MSTQTANPAARLLRSALLHPLNDVDAVEDLLAQVNPMLSLGKIKGRVIAVIAMRDETADARTFVLQPNRHWAGFKAGQHVVVDLELHGVRYQRSYSLSSSPRDRDTIAITVKRQPQGKVSNGLHDALKVGDIVGLGAPNGAFVMPETPPQQILMISAGSGITPVMSMLRDLHARGYDRDIYFLHVCRQPEDAIFAGELHALSAALPGLKLHFHYTAENGRLPMDALTTLVPDYAQRETFLCGPAAFMAEVRTKWERDGIAQRLSSEHFSLVPVSTGVAGESVEIRATRSERVFTAQGAQPLLVEAEAAGLKPRHGCRIGICQSCKCRKQSGTVQNLITGEISSEPNEMIQICITAARSDVQLDL
jgi:stearoyl-CoA 9-desaturase NADPH oxidoreductase